MSENSAWWRSPAVIGAGAAIVAVIGADLGFRSWAGTPADTVLFLGRFHPLAVHLPIGVILLVAAAEALSLSPKLRARVDPAIGLALPALAVTAFGAFVLGHMLARDGGFAPGALALHRRLELFAVVGVCLSLVAWTYQEKSGTARGRTIYRGVFGLTLGVLSVGAHFGGTLTRGDTYLSRYAPGPLKPLLGGHEPPPAPAAKAPTPGAEPLLFADVVLPMLKERCASCHGTEKVKGGLRVDSLEALLRGGENGKVVVPGSATTSPLYTRTLLPVSDDDRMPPEGKPGPTPGELALLRFWIERGADDKLRLRDALPPAESRQLLEKAAGAGVAKPNTPTSANPQAADGAKPTPDPVPERAPDAPGAPSDLEAKPSAPETKAERSEASQPAPEEPAAETKPAATNASGRSAATILSASCLKCHGPEKQKGKLRVDSLAALLRGGSEGPALVAGKPDASLMIRQIRSPIDAEGHMPPKKEPQLAASDVATLVAWVRGLSAHDKATGGPAVELDPPRGETSPPVAVSPSPEAPAPPAAAPDAASPTSVGSAQPETPAGEAPPPDLSKLPARIALFQGAVAPLLTDRCGACHAGKGAGGLSMDSHAKLMAGGSSGAAVIAGNPDASLLMQRVSLPLADGDHMPPEGDPQLTGDEIALLRRWIERGAGLAVEDNVREMPLAAQRALALRPPPPVSGEASAAEVPGGRRGGCGACGVAASSGVSFAGWMSGVGVAFALAARRRKRRS